jgi:hypothetical protein
MSRIVKRKTYNNLNVIENVQIDHHYAQCITEPFEQHLDKF